MLNGTDVEETKFDFAIKDGTLVSDILELKNRPRGIPKTPNNFNIWKICNNEVLAAVVSVFIYYGSRNIKWNELHISDMGGDGGDNGEIPYDFSLLADVISVANRSSLFKKVVVIITDRPSIIPENSECERFLASIHKNTCLENLHVYIDQKLSNGDFRSLKKLLERVSCTAGDGMPFLFLSLEKKEFLRMINDFVPLVSVYFLFRVRR
jgi:hypothetical protein